MFIIGLQIGNVPISNIGYSQDSRDREGISRNTVVGNVEIGTSTGAAINKDLNKANEVTRDVSKTTNINIESQTIEYAVNPGKLKEDIGKAKQEISDVTRAFKESVNDRGDDNRNFFGQLSEVRLDEIVENIAGEKWKNSTSDSEISEIYRMALKDLGYDNVQIIFSDPKNSPQLIDEKGKPKSGTAFVDGKGVRTIIINAEDPKNSTRSGLIGTLTEEGSHIIGKVEGRQIATGTDEKGLESTGRATNEYFQDKYKNDDTAISIQSDGKDYSNVDFGENVGDVTGRIYVKLTKILPEYKGAETTLKKVCNGNLNCLINLYGLGNSISTDGKALDIYNKEQTKGVVLDFLEAATIAFISPPVAVIDLGITAFEIFYEKGNKNGEEVLKEIYLTAVTKIENRRKQVANEIYKSERLELSIFRNKGINEETLKIYNAGQKLFGQKTVSKVEIKDRMWRFENYSKTGNVDYYLKSRKLELVKPYFKMPKVVF